jgi:hypothetical protein
MDVHDLSDDFLEQIHRGAGPVSDHDRVTYYNLISTWLDHCPLLTPAALQEAVRSAQAKLLRPVKIDAA